MAKKDSQDFNPQDSSSIEPRRFDGNLEKNFNDYHLKENQWTYARNAITNSNIGDLGRLGNEPANKECIQAPYTIIGFIHIESDKWAVFSTNDISSEIGYFEENICRYTKIVNDNCLGFKKTNIVYGISRKTFDCSYNLYWADGLNPDRYLKIGDVQYAPFQDPWPGVPYVCDPNNTTPAEACSAPNTDPQSCFVCNFLEPLQLDCNKLRLESLVMPLNLRVSQGYIGGELLNGSYFVTGAYTIDGQKVTDYSTPSNVQGLWDHSGVGGSLNIDIVKADISNFEEFELVIVSVINQQTVAKRLGIYSTRLSTITIDIINPALPVVPIEEIPINNIIYEKSEAICQVNDYALRIAPTSKFQFNYQPLANQIRTKWQSVEYPQGYYRSGGNNVGYMRDEVYAFFIRWVYNTGEKSASFHIPGRPLFPGDDDPATTDADNIETVYGESDIPKWRGTNTATILTTNQSIPFTNCDGGVVIAEGYMGYWESTEKYPDNKPYIWNASANTWSCLNPPAPAPPAGLPYNGTQLADYDLCGKNIRHHRFPDNDLDSDVSHFRSSDYLAEHPIKNTNHIRILGVVFENIRPPVDNDGNLIPGIVGYELLRGSRQGNRSIIAKGILNNMVEFNPRITGNSNITGLFQNYPYNDLGGDTFLSKLKSKNSKTFNASEITFTPFTEDQYKKNIFSFHSPETNFSNPFLASTEVKIYQDLEGIANMRYQFPADHPKHVFLKDIAVVAALIGGVGLAILATKGKKTKEINLGNTTLLTSSSVGPTTGPSPQFYAILGTTAGQNAGYDALNQVFVNTGISFVEAIAGLQDTSAGSSLGSFFQTISSASTASAAHGMFNVPRLNNEYGQNDYIPIALNVVSSTLSGFPTFLYYLSEGASQIFKLIENFSRPQQHALQIISHCYYDKWTPRGQGERRRALFNQSYVDNQLVQFTNDYTINNLYRGRFVALITNEDFKEPAITDETRKNTRLADKPGGINAYKNPEFSFNKTSSTYYAALKQRLRNQYGQLENIIQLPITDTIGICPQPFVNRVYYQGREGYSGRYTSVFVCPGNFISNPQFGNGTSSASFVDWNSTVGVVGAPTSRFWQARSVNGITFIRNDGYLNLTGAARCFIISGAGFYLISPTDEASFYQLFSDFAQSFTYTPALALTKQYKISFDVLELPAGYIVKVFYSDSAILPVISVSTIGSHVSPSFYMLPVGNPDRIKFVVQSPVKPSTSTFEFNDANYIFNCCDYVWSFPSLGNVTDDTNNYIKTGSSDFIVPANESPLPPALYDSNKINNYITNLTCPSRLSWSCTFSYVTNNNLLPGRVRVLLMKLVNTDPPGSAGTPIAVLLDNGTNQSFPTISTPTVPPYGNNLTLFGRAVSNSVNSANAVGCVFIGGYPGGIPNPDPTDKYYILVEGLNVNLNITGTFKLDACLIQKPVSITNICLTEVPITSAGCMDPNAVNFDINATEPGPCLYVGCTDPEALNYCDYCISCADATALGFTVDPSDCDCNLGSGSTTSGGISGSGFGYCNYPCTAATSNPITYNSYTTFGGDTYIGRYTEKNNFFYFTDWLFGQPDETGWDYYKYKMIPYPTYWFNAGSFDAGETVMTGWQAITDIGNWGNNMLNTVVNPSDFHVFDRPPSQPGFAIKYGYIYLFNSGVRDFFVESEYNIDFRDFGDIVEQRHYQPYGRDSFTDTSAMFNAGVIKAGNYYKYDTSLSFSKIWYSYVGWSSLYPRSYDPKVAETCYQYRPNRVLYSLPSQIERVRDDWRIYLTNNYKEFIGKITYVKQINKSGALILFDSEAPVMFQGTDQLQTDLGTKLTIGDGGLFSQPMQNLVNSDRAYGYGGCQNKLSVVNTPVGTFWISTNQGRIFYFGSNIEEISMQNMKWWLANFLPYQLTKTFPNFVYKDNPIAGIGCQTVYDNTNGLIYFTKKDYKLRADAPMLDYDPETNSFSYTELVIDPNDPRGIELVIPVEFADPNYFEDASWTISYDIKTKAWVSFHDWHPDLVSGNDSTFMTTKGSGIWLHNLRCDLYTNYYGVEHPFEVEYTVNTIQTVNTLRSIEYQLEVYKYKFDNCYDRFHVLDFNFDEAVIYNTEQCSGLLKLNITPKNNAPAIIGYPNVVPVGVGTSGQINILYSKEENKYRFNQFWDTTFDRGEFPLGSDYPPTGAVNPGTTVLAGTYPERTIWNTGPDGYKRNLNNFNLDYGKNPLQRKKFRHYTTSVLLRRKVSGDRKMLVSITNNKNLYSPR